MAAATCDGKANLPGQVPWVCAHLQHSAHPLETVLLGGVGPLLGHQDDPVVIQHRHGEHRDPGGGTRTHDHPQRTANGTQTLPLPQNGGCRQAKAEETLTVAAAENQRRDLASRRAAEVAPIR